MANFGDMEQVHSGICEIGLLKSDQKWLSDKIHIQPDKIVNEILNVFACNFEHNCTVDKQNTSFKKKSHARFCQRLCYGNI